MQYKIRIIRYLENHKKWIWRVRYNDYNLFATLVENCNCSVEFNIMQWKHILLIIASLENFIVSKI